MARVALMHLLVSVAGITAVVMAVVAASASTLLTVGVLLVVAVMLHNVLGYVLGYSPARGAADPVLPPGGAQELLEDRSCGL
jgi:predicted Na+-dependent transporter